MKSKGLIAIFYAFLAALVYSLNAPVSKFLLVEVEPGLMAGFLYLGAGIGVGGLSLFRKKDNLAERLTKTDMPYVIGMIVLDIAAPIFLMFGLTYSDASTTSLLNNFEIVATTVIALAIFKEKVSARLWIGIGLVTLSSIILSAPDTGEFHFSFGALLVLAATICWGFENNCTRRISAKDTFDIVTLKGIFSGLGAVVIALVSGEHFGNVKYILLAMLLGFVAYGLSIFFYIRAQAVIGAAKTSAYYAVAPFIGALLSFVFLKESLTKHYIIALIVMITGSIFIVMDTLIVAHRHKHMHKITHTHDGSTHTHTVWHVHTHIHVGETEGHTHEHL